MKRVSALTLPATAATATTTTAAETASATARKGHVSPACWQVKYELMCECMCVCVCGEIQSDPFPFSLRTEPARRATQMRSLLCPATCVCECEPL